MKIFLQRVLQSGASNRASVLFIFFAIIFALGAALPSAISQSAEKNTKVPPVFTTTPRPPSPKFVTPSDDYYVTVSTGASIVPGTDDTGIYCDDCTGQVSLPFDVQFYDETFTAGSPINISSNGFFEFTGNDQGCCGACIPQNSGTRYVDVVAPAWMDLITNNGIFTSVSGTAPNRIFNIEWRAEFFCCSGTANFEVRLYEGEQRIDFIYGTMTTSVQGIGVQRDTGSQYTSVACNATPASGTQYTFTIPSSCTAPPSGMVSWWPAENNGDDIISHNNLSLGPAGFSSGKVGQAFSFGANGFASAGTPSSLTNLGNQVTIDGWVNPSNTNQGVYFGRSQSFGNDYALFCLGGPPCVLQSYLKVGGTE